MVTEKKWGEYDGRDIFLYTLENEKGMRVGLTNFGCAVTAILYRGIDVVLGFDDPERYIGQTCYIGIVAGRCANRIRDGRFELDGSEFTVEKNDGNNHLHGGFKGFDKVLWDTEEIDEAGNSIRLSYFSRDGEGGYPGNLTVTVIYTLDEDCALKIEYGASTDKVTVVNLTNHAYFNLSGHSSGSIENQWLKINADSFLEIDRESIPTGKFVPVAGTPFDFREFHRIGERIESDDIQLKYPGGYDHNYVLNNAGGGTVPERSAGGQENGAARDRRETPEEQDGRGAAEGLRLTAEACSDATGIGMEVYTDMPGIQFYSGNSLNEKEMGKDGGIYGRRCGFCLETQYYPDAIHHPDFPQPVLQPGHVYRSSTVYRFKDVDETAPTKAGDFVENSR